MQHNGDVETDQERRCRLPKAELHCHIEGAASPRLVADLARRNGTDVSQIIGGDTYLWHDFTSFLKAYDLASRQFCRPEDYALLSFEHLTSLACQGAIYAEIFVSPDHARDAGVSAEDYIRGIGDGMRRAEADEGIVSRMIVVGVRHAGRAAVEAAARLAVENGHPLISGFGLAGDERIGRPADFSRAFAIAREAGLGLTAHAGELCGAESVAETLDVLQVGRLGHGVRAIEDVSLVRRIAEEGVVLETCPLSNLSLGIFPSAKAHPLRRLADAGCRVTLNSDDPPFFATSLSQDYAFAAAQGFSQFRLVEATRHAIEAAFLDRRTRGQLLERLRLAALSLGAPSESG